jgi:hypothetical protein
MQIHSIIQLSKSLLFQDISLLINRMIGSPFEQINENFMIYSKNLLSCNFEQDSSSFNPWFLGLKENNVFLCESQHNDYPNIYFLDIFQQKQTGILRKNYNDYELFVELNPVWYFIGLKIIDVFGGKMIFNHAIQDDEENNFYFQKSPLYSCNISEKFYQFQNILWKTSKLEPSIFSEFEKKFFIYD